MANIKGRVERLEATSPGPAHEKLTEIHRVCVGKTNPDGSPYVIVRRIGG